MATLEIYYDVFDRLERDEVRYVVTSGVAVVLHGHVRPIADLDNVIDPAPDEADRALRALARAGFVPSIPLPLSLLSVLRMFDHSQREVDVFVRYHIPFDELWAISEHMRVGNGIARVASLEHLLRAKRITGRPHDLLDIEELLALEEHGRNRSSDAAIVACKQDEST
ncbi:MAG: hypothetical protein H0X01_08690 [Nitrospira sp.]|nr:hypothetical protein [Nitrospira sp.]